jgi:hypothetical protein
LTKTGRLHSKDMRVEERFHHASKKPAREQSFEAPSGCMPLGRVSKDAAEWDLDNGGC